VPLTTVPRDELFFYTARLNLSVNEARLETDVNRQPRGRLCEKCTRDFSEWLKYYQDKKHPK
jgi:hypothetical protein